MTDRDFLIWLHQRLVKVHGESKFVDYMHFLREIINTTPKDKCSKGELVTMDSNNILNEIESNEQDYVGYVEFWKKLNKEHDCEAYEFVAREAWNAAIERAAETCMIISEKAGANEDDYGADRAEDCADTIKEMTVKST